jgi:hypothetical protein
VADVAVFYAARLAAMAFPARLFAEKPRPFVAAGFQWSLCF